MRYRVGLIAGWLGCALLAGGCQMILPERADQDEATPTAPPPTPTLEVTRGAPQTPMPSPLAQSAIADIRERGRLRVGVLYNYPPLSFLADNGSVKGFEPDLARQMAEMWSVEVEFVQVTRQTRLPMLYGGEVDMLAGAVPHRRELEQFLEFSQAIFRSGWRILVKDESGVTGFEGLAGQAVGYLEIEPEAEAIVQARAAELGIQPPAMQRFADLDEAAQALGEGKVRAVIARRESLLIAEQAYEGVTLLDEYVLVEPYAFAVRPDDVPLRDLIDLSLQAMFFGGEYAQVFAEHFYGYQSDILDVWPGEPPHPLDAYPAELPSGERVLERIRTGQPLRVAGLALAAETTPLDSQPIVDGYSRAVVNEMARRWGVPVAEIPASADQAGIAALVDGQADLVVGLRPQRGLVSQVAFTQGYYERGLRLAHLADVPATIGGLDFETVVVLGPADNIDVVEDNNGYAQVERGDDPEGALRDLLSGNAYAVVGDSLTLALMAQTSDEVALSEDEYLPRAYAMAVPEADPDFRSLVNFTLQDMARDGTLDALREQYFGLYLPPGARLEPISIEIWPGDGGYLGLGG
jgi:ABC-type amino acid transport substrate-binding protein